VKQVNVARKIHNCLICLFVYGLLLTFSIAEQKIVANLAAFPDPAGVLRTYNLNGDIDLTGSFFQSLGTNGRSCGSCHQPSDAMSVSAAHVQARFDASGGLDPIFRTNDGSNCDHDVDVSTLAGRSAAYSLLRTRGLIRIALEVPPNRDFDVMRVQNPYGCNETQVISMYRRPLPASNLRFLTTVMSDGRESSTQTGTTPITSANSPEALLANLSHQAIDATLGHAQARTAPTVEQLSDIVNFEMGLSTAQSQDIGVGSLNAQGATGGPQALAEEMFFVGINDPVGLNPQPFSFTSKIFSLFDTWDDGAPQRLAIYRGQTVFNSKTFSVSDVSGLNSATFSSGVTVPGTVVSTTCGLCHDTPNVGNHSVSAPLNIGVADAPGGRNVLDVGYLPVITICQRPALTTCVSTTDPGRAMISGSFTDVGKFKGPILRGLAARAPYFHNGSARSLMDVVDFYDSRFNIGFTAQEKLDLVAFLNSL
jgi:cytochrome c peroxidase